MRTGSRAQMWARWKKKAQFGLTSGPPLSKRLQHFQVDKAVLDRRSTMKKVWTMLFVAAMLVSAPALAEYPDDCLGLNEPSASSCPDGMTYEGCCDDAGRVTWCDGGQLYCIDCAGSNPSCGWQGDFYDCGTDGSGDPSGTNPLNCGPQCDPACEAGTKCVDGACVACEPECDGKTCGDDGCGGVCGTCDDGIACVDGNCCIPFCEGKNCGDDTCGGSCGDCGEGTVCMEGVCLTPSTEPGCVPGEGAGCGGCQCEACVCELDPYCCDTAWDEICVGECTTECGSCVPATECGNGLCEPGEDCTACAEDCKCKPGMKCDAGMCIDGDCTPDCEGLVCGGNGCGGSCGTCDNGFKCEAGACVEDICTPDCEGFDCGDDGCGGSCGDCAEGEECLMGTCGTPSVSCEGICGEGATGGCFCDDLCFENGDCCEDVCDFCADLEGCGEVCVPDCEGKVCGDDGCEGSCGVCEAGECVEGQCVVAAECGNGTVEGDEACEVDTDCADNEVCTDCACVAGCVPSCEGKECGDDGCGGVCGTCTEGLVCGEAALCIEEVVEGDVVSEADVTGGEKPKDEGGSSGCTTSNSANGAPLALILMALLAMVAIRRENA
jgi:hypothetical protein